LKPNTVPNDPRQPSGGAAWLPAIPRFTEPFFDSLMIAAFIACTEGKRVRGTMLLSALLAIGTAAHADDARPNPDSWLDYIVGDYKLSLSSGLDYSVGDYGDTEDTETWFLPINLKYKRGRYTFRLGTSYIWMKGPLNVTPEGDPLPGGGVVRTVRGPGDVTTSLAATVLEEDSAALDLDLVGKIKFGTADESKSLGTGENDYSLQASFFKALGSWGPYLDLGYRWKGDPPGVDYRNVWYGSAGTGYRVSKAWSAGADYSWRGKLTATSSPVSEATLYGNYRVNDQYRLNFYGVAGFSNASPDWGLGFTASRIF
jgi:hypothetical protein